MGKSGLGDEFDELRKVRNAVNYYGKGISPEEAESVIVRISSLGKGILAMM